MRPDRFLLLLLFLLIWAAPVRADEARPLYIEAHEGAGNHYSFGWRLPTNFDLQMSPALSMPPDCVRTGRVRRWSDAQGHWQEAQLMCATSLGGRSLRIDYPFGNPNLATIFKSVRADGEAKIAVFLPSEASLIFPGAGARTGSNLLWDYGVLGVAHIWSGIDHLLFVSCLIWIAGRPKRILATITGFTLAHSVTLALAALGLVKLPVKTIEVLIALSIVLLAVELAKGARNSITWRYPIAVSASFGLLHGFGFAAVLAEIGLPEDGLVRALFAFNVGIEIGQLIFAGLLIGATKLLVQVGAKVARRQQDRHGLTFLPESARLAIAYVVGTVATYWIFVRMA